MLDVNFNKRCEGWYRENDCLDENLIVDKDELMEQILENINTTPMGQVLKRIASLPEIKKNKILNLRQQINQGEYDLNERLDVALESVLGELHVKTSE